MLPDLEGYKIEVDYQARQRQMIADCRGTRQQDWQEGYQTGREEGALLRRHRLYLDCLFAGLMGVMLGFVLAWWIVKQIFEL